MFDKLEFQTIIFFHNTLLILIAVGFYFLVQIDFFYFLLDVTINTCLGGLYTLFQPQICKVYGFKQASQLFSVVNFFFSVGILASSVILKYKLKSVEDYPLIFITGGAMSVLSLVTNMFLSRPNSKKYVTIAETN